MDSIFQSRARWLIRSVDYHTLPYESEEETINVNITPSDSIKIARRNLKESVFIITRSLVIEPVKVFEMSVEMQVVIGFSDDADTSELSDNEVIQAFKKDCVGILNEIMARTSLIISEITGGSGQSPVITQPQFLE